MAIFGLLLKSIFLVALMVAVLIVGVVTYLYLRVRRVARTFAAGQQRATGSARSQSQRTSGSASSRQSTSSRQTSSRPNSDDASFANEELYDERSSREINRKIFAKDEGEYVDFEEVK